MNESIDLKQAKHKFDRLVRSGRRQDRKDILGNPIECRLTFEQWLKVWVDSGHYHEMGAGKGKYVLSRKDDIGHYEEGNVFVQSHSDNVRQSLLGKKRNPETCAKLRGQKRTPEQCANIAAGIGPDARTRLSIKANQRTREAGRFV